MSEAIGHCKDCKHWANAKEAFELCGGPPEKKGYGLCRLMRGAGPVQGALAYPDEQSGMIADLRTLAEFGCVQFEAKDDDLARPLSTTSSAA